jgi:hypothetical protein
MENVSKLARVFAMKDFANTDAEISGFVVLGVILYYICRNGILDKVIVTNFYENT